jgi:uncharacterized protein (TIGR02118 family)
MIVTVLYPTHEGAKFDAAYYKATHAPLAMDVWGISQAELIEGVGTPTGEPAPYALIGHFHFPSEEAFGTAMASPRMGELMADVANFTDIQPQIMIGRPLA